jgi:hypothetical protein
VRLGPEHARAVPRHPVCALAVSKPEGRGAGVVGHEDRVRSLRALRCIPGHTRCAGAPRRSVPDRRDRAVRRRASFGVAHHDSGGRSRGGAMPAFRARTSGYVGGTQQPASLSSGGQSADVRHGTRRTHGRRLFSRRAFDSSPVVAEMDARFRAAYGRRRAGSRRAAGDAMEHDERRAAGLQLPDVSGPARCSAVAHARGIARPLSVAGAQSPEACRHVHRPAGDQQPLLLERKGAADELESQLLDAPLG